MSDENFCKCGTISTGPTKATATSFTFAGCDGSQPVQYPANNIADYLISVIYGDASGDPPAEGCYNVCFDAAGNRSIQLVSSPRLIKEFVLQDYETIFPVGAADENEESTWGLTNPHFFAFNQTLPVGVTPTYAKLKFTSRLGGKRSKLVEFKDKFDNYVYRISGDNNDDDGGQSGEVWVPVDLNGGDYGVFLSGLTKNAVVNIKLLGFTNAEILTPAGGTIGDTGDGSSGGSGTTTVVNDPDPLVITFLGHTYNIAGADETVIEWITDPTLVGTDTYNISFDLGETIHTETVTHVVGLTSKKQRLTVNWNTLNTLRIDAIVLQGGNSGDAVTSEFGSSDGSIPVAFQSTVTV